MTYTSHIFETLGATAQVSTFASQGVTEWHAMIHVSPRGEQFQGQLSRLYDAEAALLSLPELSGAQAVMKRFFLSDSTNQQPLMRGEEGVSVSIIQQQPLDGSKVALWIYLVKGMHIAQEGDTLIAEHNGVRHLWRMGITSPEGDSAQQTTTILRNYEASLATQGASLEANCVRTWFFVRDVDTQYAGMVRARRENFVEQGLTEQTHYIASTGIGGLPADTKALIQLGAYAITGLDKEQVRYIYGATHLNPTYEYGVTFERGTAVEYADRAHIFISGTASINNRGEVMHVGDIVKQTERMIENVEVLLAEANASFADVAQIIVYLRDTADHDTVRHMFLHRFAAIPTVITLAPVCRPTWLIEMECIAIPQRNTPELRAL